MPTLVTIECHEPMGRDALARQPWSDVSLTFTDKEGEEPIRLEPTLVSRTRLEQDLKFERDCQRKHPQEDGSATIALLEKIVAAFNEGAGFYVDSKSPEDRIPEIYTANAYIDRAEAERMIVHFLGLRGLTELEFDWIWPDVICSVG